MPLWGTANEYPHVLFVFLRYKKIIMFILPLLLSAQQQIRRFFHPKNADIFLISRRKHMLWVLIRSASPRHFLWVQQHMFSVYSLEAPHIGTSNEYPQHMFSSRNKKNIMWIPPPICMGWLGSAKVSCILRHRGVQLILAYSWARPAILVAGKGRWGIFLFLLFLHFHSCSFLPYPSL